MDTFNYTQIKNILKRYHDRKENTVIHWEMIF